MKKVFKKIKNTLIEKIADIGAANLFIILFGIGLTIFFFIKKEHGSFALCLWVWIMCAILVIAYFLEDFFEDLKFKKDLKDFENK